MPSSRFSLIRQSSQYESMCRMPHTIVSTITDFSVSHLSRSRL